MPERDAATAADPAFRRDVLSGLSAPVRAVPARWLYDRRGSQLFEVITRLPEYYPTRVETALLEQHGAAIAERTGRGAALIEFGSGSSAKTPLLLEAVEACAYVPIDISGEFLRASAAALAARFPDLPIHPVEADFMRALELPAAVSALPRLGFFPGSTIGNLVPRTAVDLLRAMRSTLGDGAWLVIGMDRLKDEDTLLAAYDDAQGTTADFNLNLLRRINTELGADIEVEAFRHHVIWNDAQARIEMHLRALRDTAFQIDGWRFVFRAGETIHTENSHKYGPRDARLLLRAAGWGVAAEWTDAAGRFAVLAAHAEPPRFAP